MTTFIALFAFMLIPIWIPMFTSLIGGLADAVKARRGRQRSAYRTAAATSARRAVTFVA